VKLRVRKSELAERDLVNIYRFGFEHFGKGQAELYAESLLDVFELLALNPMMAREHLQYAKPVRIHPHKVHLIVYEIVDGTLTITRVLSHRQNLVDHL
jgi:toxin ParE1/3/4